MKKIKYLKPKLIVLSRTTPQEMVLTICKYDAGASPQGPAHNAGKCSTARGGPCGPCSIDGGNS